VSETISGWERWRQVRRQNRRANGHYWLHQVKDSADLAALVASDYDNLLGAIEACLKDAEEFDTAYQLLESLSLIVFGQGDWDRWLIYLQEALLAAQGLARYPEQARLLELIGSFARYKGERQRSEESYQAAIALFKDLGNPGGQARTMVKLAGLWHEQDRLAEGIALCEQAMPLAEASGNIQIVGDIHLNLSSIYTHAREKGLALVEAQRAYECYVAASQPIFAARALRNKASLYAQLGQWIEAEGAAQVALAQMAAAGDIQEQTSLKNDLGIAAYYQGKYQAAESLWQEALTLCSQTQESRTAAMLRNNLGKVYTRLEEWEAAEQMLRQSLAGFRALADDYEVGNVLDGFADLYEAKGDVVRCREVLQEGIDGLEKAAEKAHCQRLRNTMIERLGQLPPSTTNT
jgi:tetratricopeptide (TPR) repeat protein